MFSSDADAPLLRSEITTGLRSEVEAAGGVAETGGLGVVQLGARIPGKGPRDLADTGPCSATSWRPRASRTRHLRSGKPTRTRS
ncbi:MAG: hypothetical protein R2705_10595 [Ilumatobacteraceae bacterium]